MIWRALAVLILMGLAFLTGFIWVWIFGPPVA